MLAKRKGLKGRESIKVYRLLLSCYTLQFATAISSIQHLMYDNRVQKLKRS